MSTLPTNHVDTLAQAARLKARRDLRLRLLIGATILVWSAALAVPLSKKKLSARGPVTISLAVDPRSVRLTIDGERQQGGAYIETPAKLWLAPGQHKLKISRDGYVAHVVTVLGHAGETYRMEDVVLQKNPDLAFAALTVVGSDKDASHRVEIDDGFVVGTTPLETNDLTAGVDHTLTFYPKWPDKDGKFRCRFTPPAGEDGREYKIKLALSKKGGIKATGCDRLGVKKKR